MVKTTAVVTTYIPDGTYTYYDLWPESSSMQDPNETVKGYYQARKMVFTSDAELEKYLKTNDVAKGPGFSGEGYAPDGVLKLDVGGAITSGIKKSLEAQVNLDADYNAKENNCATNVCNALGENGFNISKEVNLVVIAGMMKGVSPYQEFHTPNNTYKELLDNPYVKVVKDAGQTVSQDYEDAVIDPKINETLINKTKN
jgi:hypothetical protein